MTLPPGVSGALGDDAEPAAGVVEGEVGVLVRAAGLQAGDAVALLVEDDAGDQVVDLLVGVVWPDGVEPDRPACLGDVDGQVVVERRGLEPRDARPAVRAVAERQAADGVVLLDRDDRLERLAAGVGERVDRGRHAGDVAGRDVGVGRGVVDLVADVVHQAGGDAAEVVGPRRAGVGRHQLVAEGRLAEVRDLLLVLERDAVLVGAEELVVLRGGVLADEPRVGRERLAAEARQDAPRESQPVPEVRDEPERVAHLVDGGVEEQGVGRQVRHVQRELAEVRQAVVRPERQRPGEPEQAGARVVDQRDAQQQVVDDLPLEDVERPVGDQRPGERVELVEVDGDVGQIVEQHLPPPLRGREDRLAVAVGADARVVEDHVDVEPGPPGADRAADARRALNLALGRDGGDVVAAGRHALEGERAVGAGDGRDLAGVQGVVEVRVEVDGDALLRRLVDLADAVAVGVLEAEALDPRQQPALLERLDQRLGRDGAGGAGQCAWVHRAAHHGSVAADCHGSGRAVKPSAGSRAESRAGSDGGGARRRGTRADAAAGLAFRRFAAEGEPPHARLCRPTPAPSTT